MNHVKIVFAHYMLVIWSMFTILIAYALYRHTDTTATLFFVTDLAEMTFVSYLDTIAALMFFLLGTAAYLVVPAMAYFVYCWYACRLRSELDSIIASVVFIITCSALGSYYNSAVYMHNGVPGGCCGMYICSVLRASTDPFLVPFFLYACLFVCLLLIMRLTFVEIVRQAGRMVWVFVRSPYVAMVIYGLRQAMCFIFKTVKSIFSFGVYVLFDIDWASDRNNVPPAVKEVLEQEIADDEHDTWSLLHKYQKENVHKNEVVPEIKPEVVCAAEQLAESPVEEQSANNTKEVREQKLYIPPSADLLDRQPRAHELDMQQKKEQEYLARILEEKLQRFGVTGSVVSIKNGPVVTLFEYQPDIDAKISKIIALEDDLALALEALSIRIIAPIPGKSLVGFEVANKQRLPVFLSTIMHKNILKDAQGLPFILGVDTIGQPVVADLLTMPHVLMAGSTGSGKSVALNVLLMSLLYYCKPEDLKLILIDPKQLEFAPYAGIAHLLFPIVTQAKQAGPILQWVLNTMEQRYAQMATIGVRSVIEYNKTTNERMPFIVVVIDELADLMMVAGKDVEQKIARIAQMARAAGIHLVVATQRPSVDVITGVIKANFPSRISFRVASKIDSRTILDTIGADKLLGKGDMLYLDNTAYLRRIHGAYVSDAEIQRVTTYVRSLQKVEYIALEQVNQHENSGVDEADEKLYTHVVAFVQSIDEISISLLQRRFKIGYNRSARIIEMLEAEGIIMPNQGGKTRKVVR